MSDLACRSALFCFSCLLCCLSSLLLSFSVFLLCWFVLASRLFGSFYFLFAGCRACCLFFVFAYSSLGRFCFACLFPLFSSFLPLPSLLCCCFFSALWFSCLSLSLFFSLPLLSFLRLLFCVSLVFGPVFFAASCCSSSPPVPVLLSFLSRSLLLPGRTLGKTIWLVWCTLCCSLRLADHSGFVPFLPVCLTLNAALPFSGAWSSVFWFSPFSAASAVSCLVFFLLLPSFAAVPWLCMSVLLASHSHSFCSSGELLKLVLGAFLYCIFILSLWSIWLACLWGGESE